jgi:CRISPR-associated protein Cas1
MLKRLVEIEEDSAHLRLYRGFLIVDAQTQEGKKELGRLPIDDIGAVIANSHGITYTNSVLVALAERGVPMALCGKNHLPAGFLLPIIGHHEQAAQIELQIVASLPLKKRLWRQLVKAKIQQQAKVLEFFNKDSVGLVRLAALVRSGDPENIEAQAARRYWPELMGERFRRDPVGESPNGMLNYGYTVLRSAVVRSIVSSGLHPSLGIHHSNDRNAFRLADDLIEPFRPFADIVVKTLVSQGVSDVSRDTKSALAKILYRDMTTGSGTETLWGSIQKLTQSYVNCLRQDTDHIEFNVQSFGSIRE